MIKIAASKLLAASMLLFASAGLNPAAAEGAPDARGLAPGYGHDRG